MNEDNVNIHNKAEDYYKAFDMGGLNLFDMAEKMGMFETVTVIENAEVTESVEYAINFETASKNYGS